MVFGEGLQFRWPLLIFNVARQEYLFVSNDMEGGDNVVETHPPREEERNRFIVEGTKKRFRIFNPSYGKYLFVSNDLYAGDNVLEAHHQPDDDRNYFTSEQAGDDLYRFYSAAYNKLLFCSNDMKGNDHVVEAHGLGRNDEREVWRFEYAKRAKPT